MARLSLIRVLLLIIFLNCWISSIISQNPCGFEISEERYANLKQRYKTILEKKNHSHRSTANLYVALWKINPNNNTQVASDAQILNVTNQVKSIFNAFEINIEVVNNSIQSVTNNDLSNYYADDVHADKLYKSGSVNENAINIYFVSSLSGNGFSDLHGLMYGPNLHPKNPDQKDFIVISGNHIDVNTLSHELGHYLGLLHTWGTESYNAGGVSVTNEKVDGSNCEDEGDFICDTPADPGNGFYNGTCGAYQSNITYQFFPPAMYTPFANNFMTYINLNSNCPDRFFTSGQKKVMNDFASGDRNYGFNGSFCPIDIHEPSYPHLPSDALYSNENTFDKTISAKYDNSYDIDSYKFRLKNVGKLQITLRQTPIPTRVYVTTQTNPNVELYSYNVNPGYIAEFETGNLNKNVNYLIHVEPRNITVPCGTYYNLTISNQAAEASNCPDIWEDNDTKSKAAYMGAMSAVGDHWWKTANIGSSTDVDYYSFIMNEPGKYRITLSNLPLDYDFFYIDDIGNEFSSHQLPATNPETTIITKTGNTPSSGYIKVIGYQGVYDCNNLYRIQVEMIEASASSGCNDNYYEPNNNNVIATPFDPVGPVVKTQQKEAIISKSDDLDYYKIDVNGKGTFTVKLENLLHDYDVFIYENNTEIARGFNGGNTSENVPIIKYNSAATVYYIKVSSGLGAFDCSAKYKLIVEWIPDSGSSCDGDQYEPVSGTVNTSVFSAFGSTTAKNTDIYATLHSASDIDYYKVTLSRPGRLRINLYSLPKNYDLKIVDINGNLLQSALSNNIGTNNEEVLYYKTSYSAEDVYVVVYSDIGLYDCDDSYLLYGHWGVNNDQNCTDNSFEPNETLATANQTAFTTFGNLTKSAKAYISAPNDNDFYKINLTGPGKLKVSIYSPPEDYNIDIFNSNGALISYSRNGGDNGEEAILDFGDAGTRSVYIKVYSAFGGYDCTDHYRLYVNWNSYSGYGCPEKDTKWENNDTPNTAANPLPLANNQEYTSVIENYIHDPLDIDYYKLNSNTKGWYHLYLSDITISNQIIIYITDKDGNVLKSSSDKSIFFEVKENFYTEYRILIKTKNNYYNCNKKYSLTVIWDPSNNTTNGSNGGSNDPCDPNNIIHLSFYEGFSSYSGNVSDGTSLVANYACENGLTGKEKVFSFTYDPHGHGYPGLTITLSNPNLKFYLLENCNPSSFCYGSSNENGNLSFGLANPNSLSIGITYYIFVDGYDINGEFTLEVNMYGFFTWLNCGLSDILYQCNGIGYNVILDFSDQVSNLAAGGRQIQDLGGGKYKISNVQNEEFEITFINSDGNNCSTEVAAYDCNVYVENCFGLEPPAAPAVAVSCPGKSIPTATVFNLQNYEVRWYESEESTNPIGYGDSFTPPSTGLYFVQFADPSQGCESPKIGVEFSQEAELEVVPIVTNNQCFGASDGSIELLIDRDTTNYLFDWSNGVSNTIKLTNLTAGEYKVTVTTEYGCESVHTFKVTEPEPLRITANEGYKREETCPEGVATLEGQIVELEELKIGSRHRVSFSTKNMNEIIGGQGTISWNRNNLKFIAVSSEFMSPNSIGNQYAESNGYLSFSYISSNSLGLPDNAKFIIIEFEVLNSFESENVIISNNNIPLLWVDNNVNEVNICISPSVIVKINPPIKYTLCDGDNTTISPIITGGSPPYTYFWSTGDTLINQTISEGGYYVLEVYDTNGCTASSSFEIQKSNPIDIEIAADTFNNQMHLTALPSSYLEGTWDDGTKDITIIAEGEGTYTYSITDNLGCIYAESIALIDSDQDGYLSPFDCNDNNADINPDAQEVVYNGIDDDCNPATLDDDLDQDGYVNADDCDDNNADINPDAQEVVYNGIDDDCNPATLDDDLDQDGYVNADDCDDNNADINPDAQEVVYNGIDDDCNPATLDDDLDQDGYVNADDCNDNNADINPDAVEIPNNGIDEDCNGSDLTTSTTEIEKKTFTIYPNPTNGKLYMNSSKKLDKYSIFNAQSQLMLQSDLSELDISTFPPGIYFINLNGIVKKFIKVE